MGVFNPTRRTEEQLGKDLEYVDNVLRGSDVQELFKDAIHAEINFRDHPTEKNTQARIELLRQLGLQPLGDSEGEWGTPQHPYPAPGGGQYGVRPPGDQGREVS